MKVLWRRPDGFVAVGIPGIGISAEQCKTDCMPVDCVFLGYIEDSVVPADRTFRAAWKEDQSTDMPKAREIWRERMRVADTHAPVLRPLPERGSDAASRDIVIG